MQMHTAHMHVHAASLHWAPRALGGHGDPAVRVQRVLEDRGERGLPAQVSVRVRVRCRLALGFGFGFGLGFGFGFGFGLGLGLRLRLASGKLPQP